MEKKENEKENENAADIKSDQKRSKYRSPSPDVKSTAVVKYTAFQSPVSYSRLQCNTDLNLPPSNWGAPNDSYGSREILTGETGLSSFRMAHMFPDCVGEVDVISSAECIKNLLKLPYQPNGTVSMMVHRVENTLLLDDFVYDYLMKSEWSWLKDFYKENILKTMSEQERSLMLIPSPSTSLKLTHKFLSHSAAGRPARAPAPVCVAEPFLADAKPEVTPNEHLYNRNVHWTFENIQMLIGSDLPIFGDKDRPCVSLRLRDAREPINVLTGIDYWLDNLMCNVPEVLMCYHLDGIVQKYEPMKTEDLPHMENSKFSPKVIRNVAQNILSFLKSNATKAGHTYWLFKGPNDDVVKLYDLTSLCPDNLDNPFTTPVAMLIYRVAKSMVIQNKAKRHVRQLLENVITLLRHDKFPQIVASTEYMLSGLFVPADTNPACPDFKEEGFDSDVDEADQEYNECEREATPEKDDNSSPKSDTNSQNIDKCERDGNTPSGESERDDNDDSMAVQIRGLSLNNIGDRAKNSNEQKKPPDAALGSGVPARCGRALHHALNGLNALALINNNYNTEEERDRLRQQIITEEQNPKMANPFEPIQMDYQPIQKKDKETSRSRRRKRDRKASEKTPEKSNSLIETNTNIDKNAILIRKAKCPFPPITESHRDDNYAWKLHLKILLYEKICLAYATLAEYSYSHEQYGFSLKYIDIASKCQKLLSNMLIKSRVVDSTCLLGRVGDNYFQLSKHWGSLVVFKKQFETDHETDCKLRQEIENDLVDEVDGTVSDEFDLDITIPTSETDSMLLACTHYRRAVQASEGTPKQNELLRRLASVTNELAVRYMNEGQQIYIKYTEEEEDSDKAKTLLKEFQSLASKSEQCLDEATKIFERVNDIPNLALLYCNRARYLRFRAHCDGGLTTNKLALYSRGEELYGRALRALSSREGAAASVWELVAWELSAHTFNKATLMQDSPDVYANDVAAVATAFKTALKHCHLGAGPRRELYQYRAAAIHRRLAQLHHSQLRITTEEGPKRRSLYQQTLANYALAANLLGALGDAGEFLQVQLEQVAAAEYRAATSTNLKLKSLQTALQLLCQCHSVIQIIKDRDPEDAPVEDEDEKSLKNESSLLNLFEQRLHNTLKNIIQYCRSKSNKDYERMTEMYKKLYMASLKIAKGEDLKSYAASICEVLINMEGIMKDYEQS